MTDSDYGAALGVEVPLMIMVNASQSDAARIFAGADQVAIFLAVLDVFSD